jgi:hypothetical protein
MIEVIASLMSSDGNITLRAMQAAKVIWNELLTNFDNMSVEELAVQLQQAQMLRFERECGGRVEGKMIMGYTAAAYYYDDYDGYGENEPKARKLREAIQKSSCSLEVKGSAERAFRERLD